VRTGSREAFFMCRTKETLKVAIKRSCKIIALNPLAVTIFDDVAWGIGI
jgi:hypothetical protein